MKSLQLKEKNWRKLINLKYKLEVKTMDDVIESLLKLVTHFKLGSELQDQAHSSPRHNASPSFFHHVKHADSEAGSNDDKEDEE